MTPADAAELVVPHHERADTAIGQPAWRRNPPNGQRWDIPFAEPGT